MARKEAGEGKVKKATIREILDLGKATERFTSDPHMEALLSDRSGTEGGDFWQMIDGLVMAIVHLPRRARSLQGRLARAEAENLRAACEECEIRLKQVKEAGSEPSNFEIAIKKLDTALVRFAVMAA